MRESEGEGGGEAEMAVGFGEAADISSLSHIVKIKGVPLGKKKKKSLIATF